MKIDTESANFGLKIGVYMEFGQTKGVLPNLAIVGQNETVTTYFCSELLGHMLELKKAMFACMMSHDQVFFETNNCKNGHFSIQTTVVPGFLQHSFSGDSLPGDKCQRVWVGIYHPLTGFFNIFLPLF